jgi:cytochrome P450
MEWNPYEELADPLPVYRWLRDEAPVYKTPSHGYYTLSRYADIADALQDHKTYSSRLSAFPRPEDLPIIQMDPPKHDELRAVLSKPFLPREVQKLEESIRQIIRRRLDAVVAKGEGDLVTEFAEQIPSDVVGSILGVDAADQANLRHWSAEFLAREAGNPGLPARSVEGIKRLREYFIRARREREASPRDDLMTMVSQATVRGARFSDSDYAGLCSTVAVAGYETTANLIGYILLELYRHPEQRKWLTKNFAGIPNAIKEAVRYCNPAPVVFRLATRDVELHGTTIPRGAPVALLLAAASRDERRYADPDRFDIRREDAESLGFGLGRHTCFGAPLARLETKLVLEEVLSRYPNYEVNEGSIERSAPAAAMGYTRMLVRMVGTN